MGMMEEEQVEKERAVIFRDARRYCCDYCGICRSKKSLITSHVLTHHNEEMDKERVVGDEGKEGVKSNTCEKCGASFKKPAYLIQHMQSHSLEECHFNLEKNTWKLMREHWIPYRELQNARGFKFGLEWTSIRMGDLLRSSIKRASITLLLNLSFLILQRPYTCSVDDCHASYRRKDHLTRHLLQHEGKLFKCQIENCNREFVYPSNLKRHVRELHDESSPSSSFGGEKQYVCQEPGCGKAFRYLSKLRKHEDSHVNLDSVEAMCLEPGCMKHFSNKECLKAHIQSSHQYMNCDICGTKHQEASTHPCTCQQFNRENQLPFQGLSAHILY